MDRSALEFRLDDYLECVAPDIPPELVPSSSLARIRAFARTLPGGITSFFGFECPLAAGEAGADFLLCSTRPEGHARLLAGEHPELDLPASLFFDPAWQVVRAFCKEWERPGSRLHEELLNTWLEFDSGSSGRGFSPNLFFGTRPPVPGREATRIGHPPLLRAALAQVVPAALEGRRAALLERTFELLPAGSYIFQVGVMLARPTHAIRLCVRGIAPEALGGTLEALGWPGPRSRLEGLVTELAPLAERIDLDFDLGAVVGPKLGLECSFGASSGTTKRVADFAAYLARRGLASSEKAQALTRYHGLVHQDSRPSTWPEYLRKVAQLYGSDVGSFLCRWVHHVKVVLHPGAPLSAKAYLAVEHHWLERSLLRAAIEATRGEPVEAVHAN